MDSSSPCDEQTVVPQQESKSETDDSNEINASQSEIKANTSSQSETTSDITSQSEGGIKNPDMHKIPVKEIYEPADLKKWEQSEGYRDLVGFITAINEAVKGKKLTDIYHLSKTTENLLAMLEKISKWIDEIPPVDQPQRFGNKAFRDFFKRLKENAETLVMESIGDNFEACIPEVSTYLFEAVGNDTRIDYGSGHELAFAAFLCCLFKVGALTEQDAPAAALKVFERYLQLARKLQTVYRMEPAGSHGVWSLDDFQFLPFLWGSSQLIGHKRIFPKSFVNPDIYEHFAKDYMFLGCIKFINQVKTGPFAEHSNQLWNISGVANWEKVNSGFIKMYKVEVLGKFPVIQHFLFGNLLSIKPAT
ncbi:serine/threonine-protein phosphatase 2A activator-like [Ostrea edulis]|uniref:serine/threonine-protein phosphatase 2A activator-like n=1 Tax=Ostrea edulis TaxID=37623 RepID=UPI0024AF4CAA|nr:serine/threonine-protein phosphatase 2A activator-like [Ostrea edulis]